MAISDVLTIQGYIFNRYSLDGEVTPVKMQLMLYLSYAHFAGMTDGQELFSGEFVTTKYGFRELNSVFGSHVVESDDSEIPEDVINALNSILDPLCEIDDMRLLMFVQQDRCWLNHFTKGSETLVPNNEILNEYRIRYVK